MTETPDTHRALPAGWIYFDGDCGFCTAQRRRWGRVFERRGFVWLPLQNPGATQQLGVTETQLQAEMWVKLADSRTFSGVAAWSALMRRVWWLWPFGALMALPGCRVAGAALYRWIAKRRHCFGGVCTIPGRK
jgi:predicted DCC family thiol-disulfide oxidoreductase YuxK